MTLITTRNMAIGFGGPALLRDIDLDIRRGEILALLGPNGSGKTTLLRTLIGALPPSAGVISRRDGLVVSYVPQRLHIDETMPMTVHRFLRLPVRHHRRDLERALERAGVPALGARQLGELSGGQFQRVLLARAILEKPDLLLLDEASQGLDYGGTRDFYRQIEWIRQEMDCTIVLVSHELKLVMQSASRVICLNRTIVCQGAPEEVAAMPEYRSLFGIDEPQEPAARAPVYPITPEYKEALNAR
ncbi:metal ABC transporter ATP-binding protein [Marinobacter sp. M1N3S26]|uniref:metal ABC transporter ATP-binding protein n=1 Tax=Marinobacter sp. M1N3S26 TaxID=3382299 RepID=UPI00387B8A71